MLEMVNALKRLDRQAFEEDVFEEYDEKYQWPLAFACVLLLVDAFLRDRLRKSRDPR